MRIEIRIAGFGGQGVGLAGYILGKAVTLHADLEAVMTQAYGPEARGGASSTSIVVADEPIDYPFVHQPDILVTLSQEAYSRFRPGVRPEASILIDDGLVRTVEEDNHYRIPATSLAEDLGRRIVANVVMLGFLTGVTGVVERAAMIKAIETSVKSKSVPLNLEAFDRGYQFAAQENLPKRERLR